MKRLNTGQAHTTTAIASLVSLASLVTLVGCSQIPYRIEFGTKGSDPATGSGTTAESTYAAPFRAKSPNSRMATWETLHGSLMTTIKKRREGDPIPRETIRQCRTALGMLRDDVAAAGQGVLDDADGSYQRLFDRAALTTPRLHVRDLERLEKSVTGAFENHPAPRTPVETSGAAQ